MCQRYLLFGEHNGKLGNLTRVIEEMDKKDNIDRDFLAAICTGGVTHRAWPTRTTSAPMPCLSTTRSSPALATSTTARKASSGAGLLAVEPGGLARPYEDSASRVGDVHPNTASRCEAPPVCAALRSPSGLAVLGEVHHVAMTSPSRQGLAFSASYLPSIVWVFNRHHTEPHAKLEQTRFTRKGPASRGGRSGLRGRGLVGRRCASVVARPISIQYGSQFLVEFFYPAWQLRGGPLPSRLRRNAGGREWVIKSPLSSCREACRVPKRTGVVHPRQRGARPLDDRLVSSNLRIDVCEISRALRLQCPVSTDPCAVDRVNQLAAHLARLGQAVLGHCHFMGEREVHHVPHLVHHPFDLSLLALQQGGKVPAGLPQPREVFCFFRLKTEARVDATLDGLSACLQARNQLGVEGAPRCPCCVHELRMQLARQPQGCLQVVVLIGGRHPHMVAPSLKSTIAFILKATYPYSNLHFEGEQ